VKDPILINEDGSVRVALCILRYILTAFCCSQSDIIRMFIGFMWLSAAMSKSVMKNAVSWVTHVVNRFHIVHMHESHLGVSAGNACKGKEAGSAIYLRGPPSPVACGLWPVACGLSPVACGLWPVACACCNALCVAAGTLGTSLE